MKFSFLIKILAWAFLVAPLTGADSSAPSIANANPNIKLTATETVLGPMNQMLPGPNGMHQVELKGLGDVVGAVVIDGKLYEIPPGFIKGSLAISPDGTRLAYIIKKDNNKRAVIIDGVENSPYDSIVTKAPVFSPDGKRVAYIAGLTVGNGHSGQNEYFIVLDGVQGKHYADIWPTIMFSPDSKHVVYIANRSILVEDGVEGKAYTGNGYVTPQQGITFSPDCKRLAYYVWEGQDSRFVVVDGIEGKRYSAITGPIVFSPDSKQVAYFATQSGKNFAVINGVEGPLFDAAQRADEQAGIFFSPDSKHVVYRVQHGNKFAMVMDNSEGSLHDGVGSVPSFSSDGRHVAYTARDGEKQCVVADGIEGKAYAGVGQQTFSPDGKHLAYWAQPNLNFGEQFVVVDGAEGKKYGRPAAGPLFSPDGQHLAFAASRSSNQPFEVVVVDGVEFQPNSPLVFDPRFAMYTPKTFYFENATQLNFVTVKMPEQQFVRLTVNIQNADK